MCFAIPKRIVAVHGTTAALEDGSTVSLAAISARAGEYLMVLGTVAVDKIPAKDAREIRQTIQHIHNQS